MDIIHEEFLPDYLRILKEFAMGIINGDTIRYICAFLITTLQKGKKIMDKIAKIKFLL